jgi:hypothetical protein
MKVLLYAVFKVQGNVTRAADLRADPKIATPARRAIPSKLNSAEPGSIVQARSDLVADPLIESRANDAEKRRAGLPQPPLDPDGLGDPWRFGIVCGRQRMYVIAFTLGANQ